MQQVHVGDAVRLKVRSNTVGTVKKVEEPIVVSTDESLSVDAYSASTIVTVDFGRCHRSLTKLVHSSPCVIFAR